MKNRILTILFLFIFRVATSQNKQIIETKDIDNFWIAFDKLELAKSEKDSIGIIQTEYIEKSSEFFKEFIKIRKLTSSEYVKLIRKHPKFWNSIRSETEKVKFRKIEIEKILDDYEEKIPNFKRPNVCFAIGCLRTGGTISENLILIGTEIASSTKETEKSEISNWLKTVIGNSGDIVSMISHETIHTQQKNGYLKNLVEHTISEGVADFLAEKLTKLNINKALYKYGIENDCLLRKEFLNDFSKNKTDISNWLYNGDKSKNRPADLGYYIGFKIAEEFYNNSFDKNKALSALLNRRNYMKIFKKSKYINKSCS